MEMLVFMERQNSVMIKTLIFEVGYSRAGSQLYHLIAVLTLDKSFNPWDLPHPIFLVYKMGERRIFTKHSCKD